MVLRFKVKHSCSEFGNESKFQVSLKPGFLSRLVISWGAVVPPGSHKSIILFHFTKVLAPAHLVAYSTANISVLQETLFIELLLHQDETRWKHSLCGRWHISQCKPVKWVLPWKRLEEERQLAGSSNPKRWLFGTKSNPHLHFHPAYSYPTRIFVPELAHS